MHVNSVMPEEKNSWCDLLLVMCVNSVMPEETFLVWLLPLSNACKFSDAKRKNPGVITNF